MYSFRFRSVRGRSVEYTPPNICSTEAIYNLFIISFNFPKANDKDLSKSSFLPLNDCIYNEEQLIAVVILGMLSSTFGIQHAELGIGWLMSGIGHEPLYLDQDHLYLLSV